MSATGDREGVDAVVFGPVLGDALLVFIIRRSARKLLPNGDLPRGGGNGHGSGPADRSACRWLVATAPQPEGVPFRLSGDGNARPIFS